METSPVASYTEQKFFVTKSSLSLHGEGGGGVAF